MFYLAISSVFFGIAFFLVYATIATIGYTKGLHMLFFNTQYRDEQKIIDELAKKIKKAETFYMHPEDKNKEVYELPGGLWISFDVVTYDLEVTIGGKPEFRLNCKYDNYDKLQTARSNAFSSLLDKARKRLAKEDKKREKSQKRQAKYKRATNLLNAKKKANTEHRILQTTLKRIKEM